jgi:hypothetical protein
MPPPQPTRRRALLSALPSESGCAAPWAGAQGPGGVPSGCPLSGRAHTGERTAGWSGAAGASESSEAAGRFGAMLRGGSESRTPRPVATAWCCWARIRGTPPSGSVTVLRALGCSPRRLGRFAAAPLRLSHPGRRRRLPSVSAVRAFGFVRVVTDGTRRLAAGMPVTQAAGAGLEPPALALAGARWRSLRVRAPSGARFGTSGRQDPCEQLIAPAQTLLPRAHCPFGASAERGPIRGA